MLGLQHQLDPAKAHPGIVAQHFVVIARDEHHPGAAMRHFKNTAQDFIMRIGPIPAPPQPPAVNDVANQEQRIAFDRAQEIDQHRRIATARAEVNIRNPHRAVTPLGAKPPGIGQIEPFRNAAGRAGLTAGRVGTQPGQQLAFIAKHRFSLACFAFGIARRGCARMTELRQIYDIGYHFRKK